MEAIQEELQRSVPNEALLLEAKEQERLLRISLQVCGTVVESLPQAKRMPQCEETVQALLCRNLNEELVTGFRSSVHERFVPGSTSKASIVELIREGYSLVKWLMLERRAVYALVTTVLMALVFTGFQVMEYYQAPFTISDSVYGSTFFLATGFYGFHVIIGTLFSIVCGFRQYLGHLD
ncbi:hypothetical protein MKW98_011617 [Papaver atlanticum]|uniref:Cytochrome c oxidase subunit 3 n=1 Tax=Papaver atlanticum TaxID=357466 RepID=A0AAD4XI83_9MAGN|nr:hypothetical protein MKW98_011617 [Papaver atlanticum]